MAYNRANQESSNAKEVIMSSRFVFLENDSRHTGLQRGLLFSKFLGNCRRKINMESRRMQTKILTTCLSSRYSKQKQHTSALLVCFKSETMVFCSHRVLVLLICIGFIAVQPDKLYGLTSVEMILRHDQKAHGTLPHNQRSLKDVNLQGMGTTKPAQANMTFDPSQTSKRRVRKGSDPIHNRDVYRKTIRENVPRARKNNGGELEKGNG
ncbi:hypothetical protein SADUNF_Sadunf10G0128500 [Salix dunnii]|uniref:Uncharacterized protein n=1 Tax=Salix dunnii TaxID=1413687 RepID=A0A835MQY9_9ROSI|nr:hypothetical protein SADUNF_Sadunf10G0128500 [Salix dunnii]